MFFRQLFELVFSTGTYHLSSHGFFLTFPIRDALRRELSWTHYRLCVSKDASVVRHSVLHENEQLFASKYRLVLPTEEELRIELERDRALLENARPGEETP